VSYLTLANLSNLSALAEKIQEETKRVARASKMKIIKKMKKKFQEETMRVARAQNEGTQCWKVL
jgi:hypothetical protein